MKATEVANLCTSDRGQPYSPGTHSDSLAARNSSEIFPILTWIASAMSRGELVEKWSDRKGDIKLI